MGKTAEELRSDIEFRRESLTRDFDAIGDRVSPQRMMERRTEALRDRVRHAKESIMGRADEMSDHAVDLRDRVGDAAGSARGSIGDVTGRASEGVHQAAEKAGEMPDMIRERTEGNPLAAGMIAFGLGLLVATAFPETRRERRLARQVQPKLEEAARNAAGTGRALAEDIKPVVQESAQHLQERARESVAHVTDQARDAAQGVAEEGKQAAAGVKDAARS